MHCIVAYAGPPSAGPPAAPMPGHAPTLATASLDALLARWSIVRRDDGALDDATMPHERAWARAVGMDITDGPLPWAAARAHEDGVAFDDNAGVALVSPTHWRVMTDQVALLDPDALALDADSSRALWTDVAALLQGDGFETRWGHATRWYARHPDWTRMPSTSIDRVVNRGIETRQAEGEAARRWRRLQNEVQMLLHTHPVNDRRAENDMQPVNSVWLSGNGPAVSAQALALPVHVDRRLRASYLASDMPSWLTAWRAIDAEVLTPWLEAAPAAAMLTLCGQRASVTLAPTHRSWWRRVMAPRAPSAATLLAALD